MSYNIDIEIVTDLRKAKMLWKKFSTEKSIYDSWDFRYCFYKFHNYPLHFIVGLENGHPIGILPLQFNKDKKHLEFFGGVYMEDNKVFVKTGFEHYIPNFYNEIKKPASLNDISENGLFKHSFEFEENKYINKIYDHKSINDFVNANFKSKSKANLLKKIKKIEEKNPVIKENDFEDLQILINLNKRNFGDKSSFNFPFRTKIFDDLLQLNFNFHLMSFVIKNKVESVSLAVQYNGVYTYMNAGTNKLDHPNLGTYVIWKNIEKAISNKAVYFDAGVEDLGWKERWHLEKIPLFSFKNTL